MYAPSEQLDQIEKQVKSEFEDIISYFEWFYEDEFTTIIIEIGDTALQIPVMLRARQIINSICSDKYIIDLLVRPVERIEASDDSFNLTYTGGVPYFIIDYYAPERARKEPFVASVDYDTMIEAVPTIYLDSPCELWARLFRPIQETFAQQQGVHSFCKETLASDLRDFLLKHLPFIEHIAKAKGHSLQILPPALKAPLPQPSNGTEPKREGRVTEVARKPQVMLQTAVAAA